MDPIIEPILESISAGHECSEGEMRTVFAHIMSGEADENAVEALLLSLKSSGETADMVAGAARALLEQATVINAPDNVMDTCGTGGDSSGSFNISSAVAFVVAAGGVPIAKHGNKAVSSKSGSADVLACLGVNIESESSVMERALQEVGICFLLAPRFHSAMRHVAPIRKKLGVRTIFNMLGPLLNPAGAKRQLIGVYEAGLTELMAEVLLRLGREKAWVVHGEDGMDEITLTGKTQVTQLAQGKLETFTLDPKDYGMDYCSVEALRGGDIEENAEAMELMLQGKGSEAYRQIVQLNAAACFLIADKVDSFRAGLDLASDIISSGKGYDKLQQLIDRTSVA